MIQIKNIHRYIPQSKNTDMTLKILILNSKQQHNKIQIAKTFFKFKQKPSILNHQPAKSKEQLQEELK